MSGTWRCSSVGGLLMRKGVAICSIGEYGQPTGCLCWAMSLNRLSEGFHARSETEECICNIGMLFLHILGFGARMSSYTWQACTPVMNFPTSYRFVYSVFSTFWGQRVAFSVIKAIPKEGGTIATLDNAHVSKAHKSQGIGTILLTLVRI